MIETKTAVEASPSTPTTTTTAAPNGKSSSSSGGMSPSLVVAHSFCLLLNTIIIKSFFDFENASNALAFYGVYHRYGWNQVVHFFGVPGIIWSLLIFMVHVPLPFLGAADASLNHAQFIAICYNLFYLSIDPLGAVLYAPVVYAMYASAMTIRRKDQDQAKTASHDKVVPWYGTGKAMQLALAVHVFCWYVQIHLGHKVIEGAQPAVLQSLGGALSVAPLFAFYEGLWVLGINKGLQESTQLLVDEYTRAICTEKGMDAMKACASLLLTE